MFSCTQGWTADDYEVGGRAWASDKYKAGGGTSMPADFEENGDDDGGERAGSAEKERYRFLLAEALGGGVVQPSKKGNLERWVGRGRVHGIQQLLLLR